MRIRNALLTRSEKVAFRELEAIADDNALRVFAKVRLSDVLEKQSWLPPRQFDFYTQAHCDFVIADADYHPCMIVEYDDPTHLRREQQERDAIKDALCCQANLAILRIEATYVTRQFGGMTVLRWIVEVMGLEQRVQQAQLDGHFPTDEPFDPAMVFCDERGQRRSYGFSAPDVRSIHDYFKSLPAGTQSGWFRDVGHDAQKNVYCLSYVRVDDKVVWAQTSIKKQIFNFPVYDLLYEISGCDIVTKLRRFRSGQSHGVSLEAFKQIHAEFYKKYHAHRAGITGSHPISGDHVRPQH